MEKSDKGFRTLAVRRKAYELALAVYKIPRRFPREETYGLSSQFQRAAVSIPANIAEGYERKGKKEYVQFLHVAKGS
jgi:four helix bundle protein